MGSWNNTCGLTNLPICAGDEVYVFPIYEVDRSGYRSHCYTNALYNPSLSPFVAKYDDYGGGDDCSGITLPFTMAMITRNLVEMPVGKNEYHDIAVKKDGFGNKEFFEAVHEHRLFIDRYGSSKRPVYFTMILKDIADRIINEYEWEHYTSKGYVKRSYKSIASDIPDLLKIYKKNGFVNLEWNHKNIASHFILIDEIGYCNSHWNLLPLKALLTEFGKIDGDGASIKLMENRLLGVIINSLMSSTRKVWLPTMNVGSQSAEYDEYKFLNKLVDEYIDDVRKDWEI